MVVHRDQHSNERGFGAVLLHQLRRRRQRLQPPQRQAVIKEAKGTLGVVAQAALHIALARPAR